MSFREAVDARWSLLPFGTAKLAVTLCFQALCKAKLNENGIHIFSNVLNYSFIIILYTFSRRLYEITQYLILVTLCSNYSVIQNKLFYIPKN